MKVLKWDATFTASDGSDVTGEQETALWEAIVDAAEGLGLVFVATHVIEDDGDEGPPAKHCAARR